MSAHRAVLLALLVVGGSLAVAAPTSATVDSRVDSADRNDAAAASGDPVSAAARSTDTMAQNDSANTSLGADISSFMQSSAAEIDGAVETGMWSASFNATEDRSRQQRLVERRTDELRTELNDLQERKAELVAERDEGNLSEAAYKARIGQLLGRINALQSAIDATEPRARQVGANVDALEMLESDAENLAGPEIAAVARNTTGVGNGSGLPDDVGNGSGSPENVGNGNDTGGASADDESVEDGTSSERGPPEDVPAGDDAETRTTESGIGPNATTPGMPGGNGFDDSAVELSLSAESFAFEPISNAASPRTAVSLRVAPFS